MSSVCRAQQGGRFPPPFLHPQAELVQGWGLKGVGSEEAGLGKPFPRPLPVGAPSESSQIPTAAASPLALLV